MKDQERVGDALRESVLRLAAGDVAGAETQARAAVAAAPNDARALQQLARAANASLNFTTAEDAAGRALEIGPVTPALLCLRAEARSGRGDDQGAWEDAARAVQINPASGQAALRAAVALEGLRRPPQEILLQYGRAAELDPALASLLTAATARLAPPPPRPRHGVGSLAGLLGLAVLAGWFWRWRRRQAAGGEALLRPRPIALPGTGRLLPRDAARLLAAAASQARNPEETLLLARSLQERLDGSLPGAKAFFERALNPVPHRRFPDGAQLSAAFRSLVDPAVE